MNDQKRNSNGNSGETKERKEFVIRIDEHPVVPQVGTIAYMTSDEFCSMISELFHGTFADFEGTIFEANNGGEPTISLVFNHGSYGDKRVGCTLHGGKATGSSTMDRLRSRDRAIREGDRYYLTEDGKDVVKKFLTNRMYNNGKINWKTIVSDYNDNTCSNMYSMVSNNHLTKVSFIDLNKIYKFIMGNKNEKGERVEYGIQIVAPITPPAFQMMPGAVVNRNYMLSITTVSEENVKKVYEKLGYGSMGSGIIK